MEVTKNDRLVNYIIDRIVFLILVALFIQFPVDFFRSIIFSGLLYFLYFFVLELAFSQTVGKLITKTKVVSVRNNRPHVFHILGRTLMRLVPIDAFSYLFGGEQGIHDILSQTRLIKIKVLLPAILLISFSSYGQSQNWEFYVNQVFMPGANFNYQYYSPTKNGSIINFYSTYDGKMRKMKTKERNSVIPSAVDFLESHINDSTYTLPLSSFDYDSLDLTFLMDKGLIQDSHAIINFELFQRHALKVVSACDSCLPIINLEGYQIDGERIRFIIKKDSTILFDLDVGSMEGARINSFRNWVLIYEAYNQYKLFDKMEIDHYFSRERLSSEIARYITVLRR